MSAAATKLSGFTLAVTHMDRMSSFYEHVLGARLSSSRMGPFELVAGTLGGLEIQLCPRQIAGIEAEQNRHQLRFVVADLDGTLEAARKNHGTVLSDPVAHGHSSVASVRDPDGNSIELIQERV